ncbi:hypothetical protein L484_000826 [Morus notabilis]|uniref:Uncharacterized protein n=1 Tax=Morus notabilis TaxID=981085 RepID=W9QBH7_9ROSA|nr:hypothetical protein L484_000826 [Morus notabilis]
MAAIAIAKQSLIVPLLFLVLVLPYMGLGSGTINRIQNLTFYSDNNNINHANAQATPRVNERLWAYKSGFRLPRFGFLPRGALSPPSGPSGRHNQHASQGGPPVGATNIDTQH